MTAARKAALVALRDSIESGSGPLNYVFCLDDLDQIKWCVDAWRGSLDAAKALHDAVLPGWVAKPVIGGIGAGVTKWHCTVEDWDTGEEHDGDNQPNPARAWLLAILSALIAEAT